VRRALNSLTSSHCFLTLRAAQGPKRPPGPPREALLHRNPFSPRSRRRAGFGLSSRMSMDGSRWKKGIKLQHSGLLRCATSRIASSTTARFTIAVLLLLSSLFVCAMADPNAPCYFPGGDSAALLYLPCYPFQFTSMCCPFGFTCFDNFLCIATDAEAVNQNTPVGTTFRSTCTNPEWNSSACANFCLGS
jgi:hypothetical protein